MLAVKPIQVSSAVDEEENQPLSPMARSFHEPDSNVYVIVMIGLKSKINSEIVKENLQRTLLKHHRFSSLQVVDERIEGGLKWVPTTVNIDNHVIVPNLDEENIDSPDKFVEDYASNLSKKGIKMSIPMWDFHFLNIKTSDAESVAVLRVHHSLGDGTSLMSLLLACTRKVSDPKELPTIPSVAKRSSAGSNSSSFMKLWLVVLLFWNTLVDVLMFMATALMFLKDTKTPLKGLRENGFGYRRFVHRSVSLVDVKLVKKAMNTTFNDVLLGITQAGLSRYLNDKYGEFKMDKGGTNNLPQNIRLRATFFVNLRPSAGIQELAKMMKKGSKAKWGNHIGYLLFPFTIALRDDPLDYLREAKATMDRKKASLEAKFSYLISKCLLKFGVKGARFPSETTFWFSNVMGPQDEISFCGIPIAYVAPSCFGQPNGLMIHVVSYAKKVTFILSVDEGIIPDPHKLCDDLEESLNLIKDAVVAKGLADQKN